MADRDQRPLSPAPLMAMATAYWASQTLFTALRMGLFKAISEGVHQTTELATFLGAEQRRTELLLKACVGLDLLIEDDAGSYILSPLSQTYLIPGRAGYMGDAIHYGDDMYRVWGHMEHSLMQGEPALPPVDYLGRDAERTRHFVYAMHNRALGIGAALINMVDLDACRQLLDVGGGPGTYAALLAQRFPVLRATVLDLPEVVALASEIISSMGVSDRVKTLVGDYHKTEFPTGNDAVLMSGIFHRETAETCRTLIERASRSLNQGGLLIICDVFVDKSGTHPAFNALFGLNMALSAPDGGVHADHDVTAWMCQAGLSELVVQPLPQPMPHCLLVGVKTCA